MLVPHEAVVVLLEDLLDLEAEAEGQGSTLAETLAASVEWLPSEGPHRSV